MADGLQVEPHGPINFHETKSVLGDPNLLGKSFPQGWGKPKNRQPSPLYRCRHRGQFKPIIFNHRIGQQAITNLIQLGFRLFLVGRRNL